MKNFTTILLLLFIGQLTLQAQVLTFDKDNSDWGIWDGYIEIEDSLNNLWQVGSPDKQGFDSSFSAPNALITSLTESYPKNSKAVFYIKYKTPEMMFFSKLNFNYMISTSKGKDGFYIEVSYDNGNKWYNLVADTVEYTEVLYRYNPHTNVVDTIFPGPDLDDAYTVDDTIIAGVPALSGNSGDEWKYFHYSRYYSEQVHLANIDSIFYRFTFVSDAIDDNLPGIIIDDLFVSSTADIISEIPNKEVVELSFYPNPVSREGVLTLNPYGENLTLSLYNKIGKGVLKVNLNNKTALELSNYLLEPDLYFYTITNSSYKQLESGKLSVF